LGGLLRADQRAVSLPVEALIYIIARKPLTAD
jgi:hypothetical protein